MRDLARPGLRIQPDWLPDETLYSLCARIHRLGCHTLSSTTTRILFGDARIGCAHDLPGGLERFEIRTQGQWGSVDALIDKHTILPYFLPFRSQRDAREAHAALAAPHAGMLKFRLGLLTSRFRAHHPLKGCPDCMESDLNHHRVAYWHLAHQYPSVWVCPEHGAPLQAFTLKSNGVRRFDWLLPDDGEFDAPHEPAHAATDATLKRIASDSLAMAQLAPEFHFDTNVLIHAYRRSAEKLTPTSSTNRVPWRHLAMQYMQALAPLESISAFSGLPFCQASAERELQRMLRAPRGGTHPIRHLALIQWLFGDWPAFMAAYLAATQDASTQTLPTEKAAATVDFRKALLVNRVRHEGLGITQGARAVGVDTTTAMTWAAQAGIETPRRAKVLKGDLREALIASLRTGLDKTIAAERFGVSIPTITRVLLTTVGLHDAWLESRANAKREHHRGAWCDLKHANPTAGVKLLRALDSAGYAWLYRHDRVWLDAFVADLPRKITGNHSNVRWDERDTVLSEKVEQAAADIAAESGHPTVALGQLCQRVPDLKAKIGALGRMPLTRRVLARVTRPRRRATSPRLI